MSTKSEKGVVHNIDVAIDNIDHNPTPTAATTSFRGTSISIFQHPRSENADEERGPLEVIGDGKAKKVPKLLEALIILNLDNNKIMLVGTHQKLTEAENLVIDINDALRNGQ